MSAYSSSAHRTASAVPSKTLARKAFRPLLVSRRVGGRTRHRVLEEFCHASVLVITTNTLAIIITMLHTLKHCAITHSHTHTHTQTFTPKTARVPGSLSGTANVSPASNLGSAQRRAAAAPERTARPAVARINRSVRSPPDVSWPTPAAT